MIPAAILVKKLSCVTNSPTRDMVIEGLITPISEYVGLIFNEDVKLHIIGRSCCDVESFMNMGMIFRDGESFGLIVHGERMLYLPRENKTRVDVESN